jgi:hypothetical protein
LGLLIKWIDKDLTFDGLSTSRDMLIKRSCNHFANGEENDFKGVVDLVRNQAMFGMKKVWERHEL